MKNFTSLLGAVLVSATAGCLVDPPIDPPPTPDERTTSPPASTSSAASQWTCGAEHVKPGTLAELDDEVRALAQDETHLFVASRTRIDRIDKLGGSREMLVGPGEMGGPYLMGLAVDARAVYWTNLAGSVRSVPKSGGAIAILANGEAGPWGLAVDATHVYWATNSDPAKPTGAIRALSKADGSIATLASAQRGPMAVALDDDAVYFSSSAAGSNNGSVRRVSKTGGEATVLIGGQSTVLTLVTFDGGVFFLEDRTPTLSAPVSALIRVPAAGGEPRVIDPLVHQGWPVSATRDGVVYSSFDSLARRAELRLASADGQGHRVVGSRTYGRTDNTLGPVSLVADDARVFFVDFWWNYDGGRKGSVIVAPLASP